MGGNFPKFSIGKAPEDKTQGCLFYIRGGGFMLGVAGKKGDSPLLKREKRTLLKNGMTQGKRFSAL